MKKCILYLPDISINNSIEILNIFNFKNIKIYTTSIYDGNRKVGKSCLKKIKNLIVTNQILTLIIYEPMYIPIYELNIFIKLCSKYKCKLYFFYNFICVQLNTNKNK